MPNELQAFFAQIPLFSSLSPGDLAEILGCVTPRVVKAGQPVFREGETGDAAYVVEQGRLRTFIEVDGAPVPLGEVGVGQVVGELLLVDGPPYNLSATAAVDTRLMGIDRVRFEQLRRDRRPAAFEVLRQVAKVLEERIHEADQRIRGVIARPAPAAPEPIAPPAQSRSWLARMISLGHR